MTLRAHLDGSVFAEHLDGRPPPVLALHGWGRDRTDLLTALSGRQLVSLDLPGFGASPPPSSDWGSRDYADAVAKVVRELGPTRPVVVGHSFGGRVGTCLAARHPELVSGLVLMGTPLLRRSSSRRPPLAYRIVRRLWKMGVVPESRMETFRRRFGSADYRDAEGRMRSILVNVVNEDYSKELADIRCPVAFVWGSEDSAAPLSIARDAAKILGPNLIEFDVNAAAGHDVHHERPDRVAAAVDAVLGAE